MPKPLPHGYAALVDGWRRGSGSANPAKGCGRCRTVLANSGDGTPPEFGCQRGEAAEVVMQGHDFVLVQTGQICE